MITNHFISSACVLISVLWDPSWAVSPTDSRGAGGPWSLSSHPPVRGSQVQSRKSGPGDKELGAGRAFGGRGAAVGAAAARGPRVPRSSCVSDTGEVCHRGHGRRPSPSAPLSPGGRSRGGGPPPPGVPAQRKSAAGVGARRCGMPPHCCGSRDPRCGRHCPGPWLRQLLGAPRGREPPALHPKSRGRRGSVPNVATSTHSPWL